MQDQSAALTLGHNSPFGRGRDREVADMGIHLRRIDRVGRGGTLSHLQTIAVERKAGTSGEGCIAASAGAELRANDGAGRLKLHDAALGHAVLANDEKLLHRHDRVAADQRGEGIVNGNPPADEIARFESCRRSAGGPERDGKRQRCRNQPRQDGAPRVQRAYEVLRPERIPLPPAPRLGRGKPPVGNQLPLRMSLGRSGPGGPVIFSNIQVARQAPTTEPTERNR